jgi:hypothetical protein
MIELFAELCASIDCGVDNVSSRLEIALNVNFRFAIFRLESESMRTNMTGDLSDLHDQKEFTTTVKRSKRGEALRVFTPDTWVAITFLSLQTSTFKNLRHNLTHTVV